MLQSEKGGNHIAKSNKQWLNGGNCSLCRRKNSCKKTCKESMKVAGRQIAQDIYMKILKLL